jgi:uncharacterized damage-inducible protein DinB
MRIPTVRLQLLTTALALTASGAAHAQLPGNLKVDWERSRKNVIAYTQAMPATATGFRPTPGVRTFAEQFDHIATTNYEIAALALKGLKQAPALGDSAKYLHDKAALVAYIAATYDYVLAAMATLTAADLNRSVSVWGLPAQSVSRWLEMSLEHSVWTLGQVVPYLRLNGATPPAYDIPF